jgi:hypothetical protein
VVDQTLDRHGKLDGLGLRAKTRKRHPNAVKCRIELHRVNTCDGDALTGHALVEEVKQLVLQRPDLV